MSEKCEKIDNARNIEETRRKVKTSQPETTPTEENMKRKPNNMEDGFNVRDYIAVGEMTEKEIERCEFWIQANRIVRETGKSNLAEAKIEVNSNWDLNTMEQWLEGYHDQKVIQFLKYGWPLNAKETAVNSEVPENQKGARTNKEDIRKYLKEEIENGSVIGPFTDNPFGIHA